jgi:penicillin-binding protein 2
MGMIGLESGHGVDQRFFCPGWFSLPNSRHRYRCWKKSGHGWLNLKGAIEQSCDVYFYRLATQLGIDRMHKHMTAFGFGRRSGVDLDDEPEGLMPSREWKEQARGEVWYPGETVIAGIGQGYTLVTPLQLAVATATLANRGQPVRPRFLRAVEDAQTRLTEELAVEQLPLQQVASPAYYDIIVKAMEDVVHGKRGTARRMGMDSRYRFAGKTGTAQVINIGQNEKYDADKLEKRFHDHALFIAFAPLENPKIVVAVVAENGGSGSKTAAPMARKVMDYYLIDRHHRA